MELAARDVTRWPRNRGRLDRTIGLRYVGCRLVGWLRDRAARLSNGKSRTCEATEVTILRVGTNQKYSDGWEAAFAGKKAAGKATAKKKPAKKSPKKAKR